VLGLILALCASASLATSASAATPPTMTESFPSTGAQQTFEVPVGVSSIHVEAIGATGEAGFAGALGGAGAVVAGNLPVTAGETIYVEVGGAGFNGGGAPGFIGGGYGGAASDVRTVPLGSTGSLESRLLVAAGGGGGGAGEFGPYGGAGGAAGNPGTNSSSETSGAGGAGGGAGTLTGGGSGGTSCGSTGPWTGGAGSLGLGGSGGEAFGFPFTAGGGGGGGYMGGGGGEGTCRPEPNSGGGGGGGGSSFVFGGATFSSFGAAAPGTAPSISISYPSPATATPSVSTLTFGATQPLQTLSPPATITLTNEGGNPLQVSGTTFADSSPVLATDHPEDFLIGSSSCLGPVVFEASCQLTVRFVPQGEGTRTATLQVTSNAGIGPTVIKLVGTGGTLPQGPSGEPGARGEAGAQGEAGANGQAGPAGSQGPAGAAGAAGSQGPTGTTGPTGPTGPKGPRGATGKRGPAGPTAVYVCHPRQGGGSYQRACFVRLSATPKGLVRATVTRRGVLYANGAVGKLAAGGLLELKVRRPIQGGRYTLALVYGSKTVSQTITLD
jgi:hypothetical protein